MIMPVQYKKLLALSLLFVGLLVMAPQGSMATNPPKNLGEASIADAQYSFPVQDLRLDGNKVRFTILKDANKYNWKADAVKLSGMYATDQKTAQRCPVVDSHYVDKVVEHYNPISGKAEVVATFDDPAIAARATETGCVLIHDVD
jgi:hypothetical protein